MKMQYANCTRDGTGLIITVDNGVSAVNEAELIHELGMKLVITDHHQLPEDSAKSGGYR